MPQTRYDCNCDTVLEMEQMGIGVEEMLQYAKAMLTREQVAALLRGLEEMCLQAQD